MRAWANLYPWDVDGDPAAADRMAGLGLAGVTLAAAYHAVRAVTPFHPRHRIVTRDAAAYYRPDPARWHGARLRPPLARPGAGSFERAAARLRARGVGVTAWAVVTHNGRLGAAAPSCTVRNAYGDRYPWALCLAAPAVRDYAAGLAAEVAALPGAGAVELEACGWYGAEHGGAHDKTGRAAAGTEAAWLLSACFCPACRREYLAAGADPAWLGASARAALDPVLRGEARAPAPLPADAARVLLTVRSGLAARFQRAVVAAARAAAPGVPVYLHMHPDPRAAGANPGCDPATAGADGIVLSCWDPATAPSLVTRAASAAPPGTAVAASLLAVAGLGGDPGTLAGQAAAVRAAGATELRLYHAGLASAGDLAAIRSLCRGGP